MNLSAIYTNESVCFEIKTIFEVNIITYLLCFILLIISLIWYYSTFAKFTKEHWLDLSLLPFEIRFRDELEIGDFLLVETVQSVLSLQINHIDI
jgi:hypothetical protein